MNLKRQSRFPVSFPLLLMMLLLALGLVACTGQADAPEEAAVPTDPPPTDLPEPEAEPTAEMEHAADEMADDMEMTTVEMEFIPLEAVNVDMGFPVQHVYIEDENGMIVRPVVLNETTLPEPIFTSAEAVPDDYEAPYEVGPFEKGHSLDMTLEDWVGATGTGTYTANGDSAELDLTFDGLVPNGVYTLWCVMLDFDPFAVLEELPCGATDGSDANVTVDENGHAHVVVAVTPFVESTIHTVPEVSLAYHSDGETHGQSPGAFSQLTHVQLIYDFLPPEN